MSRLTFGREAGAIVFGAIVGLACCAFGTKTLHWSLEFTSVIFVISMVVGAFTLRNVDISPVLPAGSVTALALAPAGTAQAGYAVLMIGS